MSKKKLIFYLIGFLIITYMGKVIYYFSIYYDKILSLEKSYNSYCMVTSPVVLINGSFELQHVLCMKLTEQYNNIIKNILWPFNEITLELTFYILVGVVLIYIFDKYNID